MAIIATCVMMTILIPFMGLAIDVSLLYVDKTHLQAAVDGAALAGAHSLSRGTTDSAQQTAAKLAAAEYVFANFPSGFLFSSAVTVNQTTDITIDETVAYQRTIAVTGHVTVPTLFMRWLSFTSNTVNASATVTRKDVNVVMVIDRSGSLAESGSCSAVIAAAQNFLGYFANGTDNVGLVSFSSTTTVDFAIANDFDTATTSASTIISNYQCIGSTSSAMGLWTGYDQLVGLNQPGAMNVILFFTDGDPTGVNVVMPVASGANCRNSVGHLPATMTGVLNTYINVSQWFGLLQPTSGGAALAGMSQYNGNEDTVSYMTTNGGVVVTGCSFQAVTATSPWVTYNIGGVTNDFSGVPVTDVYGDDLRYGSGSSSNPYQATTMSGSLIDLSNAANAFPVTMNGELSAALHIIQGATEPATLPHSGHSLAGVQIFSIGLGNAPYPLSVPNLQAVSNVPASPWYNSSYETGLCEIAPTLADLNSAFAQVASQILRLAK
jgi:Flp pilus assembly protein TadG